MIMNERKKVLELFEKNREYMDERIKSGIERNRKGYARISVRDKDGNNVFRLKYQFLQPKLYLLLDLSSRFV